MFVLFECLCNLWIPIFLGMSSLPFVSSVHRFVIAVFFFFSFRIWKFPSDFHFVLAAYIPAIADCVSWINSETYSGNQ